MDILMDDKKRESFAKEVESNADFDESKHPRDNDGKFSSTGGGGKKSEETNTKLEQGEVSSASKKEFDINGKKFTVENGAISINGKLAHKGLKPDQFEDAETTKSGYIKDLMKKNNIDPKGKVFLAHGEAKVVMVPREVAEEAINQTKSASAGKITEKEIPGYDELFEAYEFNDDYRKSFNKMMNDEFNDGIKPPEGAPKDIKELTTKYPQAAAYIAARSYSKTRNDVQSSIGREAMSRILKGEDHNNVIKEMKNKWSDEARRMVDNN
jgi:cyanate lyase